ncbi:MAG: hypothetical protein KBC64_00930 [Simkaniaceae bacterium]|nr:hypothetical protein [Simkaniaceae bacterium]
MSNLAHSGDHYSHESKKEKEHKGHLFPIDETEEFHDPFSALNLFLSKKIKQELDKSGTARKWSHKIQDELLQTILPEFKEIFPKYRLGGTALKKIWDKVSYYYNTVTTKQGALNQDGRLNLPLMIRENLRTEAPLASNLPPYAGAHQIAVKMSECIASLEGECPDLSDLTKTIWAVQKHLIKNLPSREAKSPYEDYDLTDKIVVKTLLEITSSGASHSLEELKGAIQHRFNGYHQVKSLHKKNELVSLISALLAKGTPLPKHFALKSFIHKHLSMIKVDHNVSNDAHLIETVQRILALYPVMITLPKISKEELSRAIHYTYHLLFESEVDSCPVINQSILIFVNAEMRLFQDLPLELIESTIIESYSYAQDLPRIELSHVEAYIWQVIDENEEIIKNAPAHLVSIIETELANVLIDHLGHPFRRLVQNTVQFFKKAMELDLSAAERKIHHWAIQNDMICRWIHFDSASPLLKMAKEFYKEGISHDVFIDKTFKTALKMYPELKAFESQLRVRVWILYKFLWYSTTSSDQVSSFDRFIAFHKSIHPDLEAYLDKALPFNPRPLTK